MSIKEAKQIQQTAETVFKNTTPEQRAQAINAAKQANSVVEEQKKKEGGLSGNDQIDSVFCFTHILYSHFN